MSYQKDTVFNVSKKRNLSISKVAEKFGWTGMKLNNVLAENGVIFRDNDTGSWCISDQYKNNGYAISEDVVDRNGSIGRQYLKWTYEGRKFICQLLKDKFDLLPNSEAKKKSYCKQDADAKAADEADGCITITDFVHVLASNQILVDGSVSHHSNVYDTLRNDGFLNNRRGYFWNLPYPEFDSFGYFKIAELKSSDGKKKRYFTKLTPKGQAFFLRYFKKKMDERNAE